jgi:hypothetical protein
MRSYRYQWYMYLYNNNNILVLVFEQQWQYNIRCTDAKKKAHDDDHKYYIIPTDEVNKKYNKNWQHCCQQYK